MEILVLDGEWQYPAITEKHAYTKIVSLKLVASSTCYVAFPWATYIDLLKNGKDTSRFEEVLKNFKERIKAGSFTKVITVCQHIRMMEITNEISSLGVTDIYWSHKVLSKSTAVNIKIHPFPLYATQTVEGDIKKDILYSFVGAKSTRWYLTDAREQIINRIASSEDVIIKGRDEWHYNDIVYREQVSGVKLSKSAKDRNDGNTKEYLDIMARSKYALCPSGSGPNSIRLWECIEMGIVPVVLADTYEAPKHHSIFQDFAIMISETKDGIDSIDQVLRGVDEADYQNRLAIMNSYKLLYGRDSFVYDIVENIFDSSETEEYSIFLSKDPNVNLLSLNSFLLTTEKISKKSLEKHLSKIESKVNYKKDIKSLCNDIFKFKGVDFEL